MNSLKTLSLKITQIECLIEEFNLDIFVVRVIGEKIDRQQIGSESVLKLPLTETVSVKRLKSDVIDILV